VFELNPVFALLERALDAAQLRQAVHTANIANADAPDFKRLEVQFSPAVDADLTSPGALADLDPSSLEPARVTTTGEAVRLDQEMALMSQDAVRYQALLAAFERTMGLLNLAARDGRPQG
jgi:flagellar basal-body rod protein FlgB